jgi:hypothetical protein
MVIGTVAQWYRNDIGFSLPLISSFVQLVEDQVKTATQKFRSDKFIEIVEDDNGDYGMEGHPVISFGGLDSDAYDIDTLWEEYFPNLLRRSALITVYGYFEHELVRLCYLYRNEKHFRLSLTDLKDDGILGATNYLWKVANLNVYKDTTLWRSMNQIRIVRNRVVHHDGRIADSDGQIRPELSEAIKQLEYIQRDKNEVFLEEGFVSRTVDIFSQYFKLIDDSIQEAEKHP